MSSNKINVLQFNLLIIEPF